MRVRLIENLAAAFISTGQSEVDAITALAPDRLRGHASRACARVRRPICREAPVRGAPLPASASSTAGLEERRSRALRPVTNPVGLVTVGPALSPK